MERRISVSDITMKLADNRKGCSLSFREKIELSKLLDKLGVSVIETTPVLNGKQDSLLVKSLSSAIKESTLAVPVSIVDPDSPEMIWNALKYACKPRLQVSVPVSTVQMEYLCHKKPSAVLDLITVFVSKCRALCPEVEFIAEDSGRSEADFLLQAVQAATEAGASVVTICDTAGSLFPEELYNTVKSVKDALKPEVKLAVLCSNDLFIADSCAVAAVMAGADEIKTTAYGKETASLTVISHILNVKADQLKVACGVRMTQMQRLVAQIQRLCEAKQCKAASAVEGVHNAASDIELTINDSKETVLRTVSDLGYDLSDEDGDKVYDAFVRLASKNEIIEAKELDAIVASEAFQVPPTYNLVSYVITSGNTISATCYISITKREEKLESVCMGDGPVDAAFLAIEKVVGRHYELDDFQIQSVTEGREAMGEAVVRLRYGDKIYSGRGISTDIIGSSVRAYINALNKIAYEEDEA